MKSGFNKTDGKESQSELRRKLPAQQLYFCTPFLKGVKKIERDVCEYYIYKV